MSTLRYAAYGSNLHPRRLSLRIASARLLGTAFLEDWSLHFHKRSQDGSAKCTIREGGNGVHVAVFQLSRSDKAELDKIEGVGDGYSELLLDVPGFGACHSYIAADTHTDTALQPYDWYKELVLAGARLHGFPGDYIAQIEHTLICEDQDIRRRHAMREVVRAVRAGAHTEHRPRLGA